MVAISVLHRVSDRPKLYAAMNSHLRGGRQIQKEWYAHRQPVLLRKAYVSLGVPVQHHAGPFPTPESYRGNVSCSGPRACYDESKRVGETLCYVFHTKFGTFTNVVRPFNVFGPGMQETDYRALPNFASRIKAGKPLRVYGAGNQTRTFCYVTDALVGFMLIMLRGVPGEAYNIGTPEPEVSIVDLVHHLEKTLGRSLETEIVEHPDSYPADEPQRRCPLIRKARLQLGYEPLVELDEGLKRFLSWTEATYTGVE